MSDKQNYHSMGSRPIRGDDTWPAPDDTQLVADGKHITIEEMADVPGDTDLSCANFYEVVARFSAFLQKE